jgi:hypothetical protein
MLRAIVVFFLLSVPVLADTLVSGSVYFDSQNTLQEVVKLSAAKDNESILKLINSGHISQQTDTNKDIVILATGQTSESPAEFRFVDEPTTYWTLTKFVNKEAVVEPTPMPEQPATLTARPEPTAAPIATPERMTTVTKKRHRRASENNDPMDDDHGRRIWHKVDGQWKWYPAHRKPVSKTLPPDQAPAALPAKP